MKNLKARKALPNQSSFRASNVNFVKCGDMSIYSWGAGNHGQLLNGLDDHSIPVKVELLEPIQLISGGGAHTLLILGEKLHSVGSNEEGQLGIEKSSVVDHSLLQQPQFPSGYRSRGLACGWSHSLVLSDAPDGQTAVIGFGGNDFHQLALSASQTSLPTAIPLPIGLRVAFVACGMRHSAFVCDSGALWLFGENRFGQCGVSSLAPIEVPTRAEIEGKVSSVSLGARHTVCALNSGRVLSFGENRFGQCGVNPASVSPLTLTIPGKKPRQVSDILPTPTRVDLHIEERPNTIVKCGWNFSLVWQPPSPQDSLPGAVVLFGRNHYGQLGRGTASPFEWSPNQPYLPSDLQLVQVECGSEHTLLLSQNGSVWAFGWNEHGQLGFGDEQDRHQPTLIPPLQDKSIDRIACGYGFSFAISNK